jgi:GGDEF domain-containing protein
MESPGAEAFEEIERLREKIARLEERVRQLDALAHQDSLVHVPNRRGFMRELEALIHVANALAGGVRKSDCVARLGGDEFGILLVHADEETARETASRLTRLIEEQESHCDGNRLPLSVAIGVTMVTANDTTDAVISRADRAMYAEKSAAA